MATGYTYPVAEGKITEFAEFAMQCARAFGATITMRDEPMDAPIPTEFAPSDYHEKRLAEARQRMDELRAMTIPQVEQAAEDDFAKAKRQHEEYEAKAEAEDDRIVAMLAKVRAWEPPTAEHIGLKDFMIDQLQMSRRGSYRSPLPTKKSGPDWLRVQIEKAQHDISYHAAEQAKEVERTRGRTQWVQALRKSFQDQVIHVA